MSKSIASVKLNAHINHGKWTSVFRGCYNILSTVPIRVVKKSQSFKNAMYNRKCLFL